MSLRATRSREDSSRWGWAWVVGRVSDEAEFGDGVAFLDEFVGGGVDLGAAEVVDVEALDDLVVAVLAVHGNGR